MILVTQGHEHSIGLEVFIKSFLCLDTKEQRNFKLYCFKNSLIHTLDSMYIPYFLDEKVLNISQTKLNLNLVDEVIISESLSCIDKALEKIKASDILLTLPTSKNQFGGFNGHTEYLRNKFNLINLPMSFFSQNMMCTLLTDHISISDVSKSISSNNIIKKIKIILDSPYKLKNVERVIFSGINPHNGEEGLMGSEEEQIFLAINELKILYPSITFLGPYPGDTLVFNEIKYNDLLVFSAHDQGLGIFKQQSGLFGINITYGLPFLRISPDHGTACDLYLQNRAQYQGCLYLMQEILK